jgi:hypothetical protein
VRRRSTLFLLVLHLALPVRAQTTLAHDLDTVQSLYDAGKFSDSLSRARALLSHGSPTDAERIMLHRLAGLSAFNLSETKAAEAQFLDLLRLNPDYVMDPFAAPPPAVRLFTQVRASHEDELNLARQQIALRAEKEARARTEAEADAARKRVESMARAVTVRTIEKHSLVLNFIPFGVGQFEQGRTSWGVGFAATEILLGSLSVAAYFVIDSMFERRTYSWNDRLTPDGSGRFSVDIRTIPAARRGEFETWSVIKYASGAAFYAACLAGIGDALWHHQAETVVAPRSESKTGPALNVGLTPLPGGLGAGMNVRF